MKILVVHNRYHLRGGEEGVFEAEVKMLRENGHEVDLYEKQSENIVSLFDKVLAGVNQIFSFSTYFSMRRKIKEFKPDIVHVHNFFPLISPSVFYACKRSRVPVVQTLHNYRPICPTGFLLFNGEIEERSILEGPFWAVRHGTYRNSKVGTALLAFSIYLHRRLGTWRNQVDQFIALTEFQRDKYVSAGWPREKFSVKPNFVDSPIGGSTVPEIQRCGYFIYIGRISDEKGVRDLVEAWREIDYPLKIVGDGPLTEELRAEGNPNIEWLGHQSKEDVYRLLQGADLTVMASRWYEGFPLVLLESFACSTAALVPRIGGLPNVVLEGETGFLFEPGDIRDLRLKIKSLIHDRAELIQMGQTAQQYFLDRFTKEENYKRLLSIYTQVLREASNATCGEKNYEYE